MHVLTAKIAAAYVSHVSMMPDALPPLLTSLYDTLSGLGAAVGVPPALAPAVPPKESVFPDYIICLEDGRPFKTLKRHLMSAYKLTPDQYRARWNLPADYPMVAPNYSAHRTRLAKAAGLGGAKAPPAETPPDIVKGVVVTRIPAARRGRRRKA
ncbi:MucR family transcriptional regulator [Gluconacetobacter sp. 1c LMG 22058]|uniref:MucR family transcriptional regulator n=1 Tax=Gluconacetobacter dulcium TaxID=2729096 RepID=A0A7W4K2E0_9PROT|nr:MucR family transcriptional regulator [Gluconacetobacter dulcium]